MLIPSQPLASASVTRAAINAIAAPTTAAASSLSMMAVGSSSLVKSMVTPSAALSIARGGAEIFAKSSGGLDIGRVRMRLEGLQAYATLCALLTNACLRLYSSVKVPRAEKEKEDPWARRALDAFLLCIVVSVLFGSYTTIVFSLLALYSKTALGRGYDQQFLEFFAATSELRESGFRSFLYSLLSFETAFILSLVLRFDGSRRRKLVFAACLISSLSVWRWSTIMHLAGKHLFTLKAEIQY